MNHEIGEIKKNQKCKIGNLKKDFLIYNTEDIKILGYDLTGKTYTNTFLINSTLQVNMTSYIIYMGYTLIYYLKYKYIVIIKIYSSLQQKYDLINTPLISAFEMFNDKSPTTRKLSMVCVPEILKCKTITFRKHQFEYITRG